MLCPPRSSTFTGTPAGAVVLQMRQRVGENRGREHSPRWHSGTSVCTRILLVSPGGDACSSAPLPCISFYLEEVRGVVPKRGKSQTLCHRLAGAPRTGRRGLGALVALVVCRECREGLWSPGRHTADASAPVRAHEATIFTGADKWSRRACVRTVHVRDFARLDFIPLTQHSRSHRSKTNDVRPCGASPRPPAAPRARSLCEP